MVFPSTPPGVLIHRSARSVSGCVNRHDLNSSSLTFMFMILFINGDAA